jgi:DNA-binding GntR family transcriptional regulator
MPERVGVIMASLTNKERLYADLKRRILTLDLEPGAHLDETSLSAQYGISRTPLREVFRQLAGEGYIQIRDNRGTIVSPMSHKSMRDFFLTAPLIYASIARLAAQNARPEQIAELRDIQARFRKAVEADSPDDMIYWNDRFHFVMGQMADNQYLMPSLQRLLIDHARIGQTFWRPRNPEMRERIHAAADQHDRFIEFIEAGDAEGAVALTLEHWGLSRDHIEMFVRPEPLPIDMSVPA